MRRLLRADKLALIWASAYIILFMTPINASIYFPLIALKGVWGTAGILIAVFGIWGTIFYLMLLKMDAFDQLRKFIDEMSGKKEAGFFAKVQLAVLNIITGSKGQDLVNKMEYQMGEVQAGRAGISLRMIILVFVFLSPVFGVPLIRLAFPREHWGLGLLWVWVGASVEVATWFLPYYGGIFSILKLIFLSIMRMIF